MSEERAGAIIEQVARVGSIDVSPEDLPLVDRALDCALPVYGFSESMPDFPQVAGTCFAVEYRGASLLLSAKHVIDNVAPEARPFVPRGFDTTMVFQTGEGLETPEGVFWLSGDAADPAAHHDIAVLPFAERPRFRNEVRPLRMERLAVPAAFEAGALFAVAGYPSSASVTDLDYDRARFQHSRYSALAKYVSPAERSEGVHILECDTSTVGGPNGVSGGPVLRILIDERGRLSWALAGIVIWGGPTILRFIDATHIARLLDAAAHRFGWPPRLGVERQQL